MTGLLNGLRQPRRPLLWWSTLQIVLVLSSAMTTPSPSSSSSSLSSFSDFQPRMTQLTGQSRSSIHENILDTIGSTPIIKLQRMGPPEGADIYVKCETENPGGSIKDRLAMGCIEWGEQTGKLTPGQTVVEATSGNTGIALAMVCAVKGYPLVCVMSEDFSVERRKLMRFLGAKVILTNPSHKTTGMVIKAKELALKHGYFYPNQFENEVNAWIHEKTTGPEIVNAFKEKNLPLDHFFTAYGTGGHALGIARVLRQEFPDTKIHLCEPDNAPLLHSEIPTTYFRGGQGPTAMQFEMSHPAWGPHWLQGWTADFVPNMVSQTREGNMYDELCHVTGKEAIETSRQLAMQEGILTGPSGGGILSAALRLAKKSPSGTSILAMLPDTGERYLSTALFDGIPAAMTEDEGTLTVTTSSAPPPPPNMPDLTNEAMTFVQEQIASHKVLVWSLQYCDNCATLTRFLDRIGVPYERIDLDKFEWANKEQLGNQYRVALERITERSTFPQLFLDGEFLGGAVDVAMMWKKDRLQPLLTEAGLAGEREFNGYNGDPFEFLPKWMTTNPLGYK